MTISIEERKKYGKLYDEYLKGITESTEEIRKELEEKAEAAWGTESWRRKGDNLEMLKVAEGILGSRVEARECGRVHEGSGGGVC